MTTRTVYVPRLIESAEQAEALPVGTVAVHYPRHGMEDQAAVRVRGGWEFTGTNPHTFDHREAVGMEALVPIEAREETTHEMRTCRGVENFAPSYGIFQVPSRRLVTPWEEA